MSALTVIAPLFSEAWQLRAEVARQLGKDEEAAMAAARAVATTRDATPSPALFGIREAAEA